MPVDLPENPDFEHLRKLAKELARGCRAGEPDALARVHSALPHMGAPAVPLRLSHAQATLAREYGFPSWPKLKAHVLSLEGPEKATALDIDVSPAGMVEFRRRPAAEIAAVWLELGGQLDFDRLVPALALGRRKGIAVRDYMVAQGTLSTFVDALLVGIRHHNPNVRHVCAHAMDGFADERCAAALARLLDDPVPRVRRIAVHSLGCDDCKVVPLQGQGTGAGSPFGRDVVARVVEMALSDPSIQVRRHATVALPLFEDVRATQAIERLAAYDKDGTVRKWAVVALRQVRAR